MYVRERKALGERLRRADVATFERLYGEYFGLVRSFLRVYLGDRPGADDLAQDIFLQLWRHPDRYNPSRATLKIYLFAIARKKAADWWRKHPTDRYSPRIPASTELRDDLPLEKGSNRFGETLMLEDALNRVDPEFAKYSLASRGRGTFIRGTRKNI
jgi:RNA polymerase sigma factor (sigma-70 family)